VLVPPSPSQKACEENYPATYAINVTATVELAERLIEAGAFVVFLSTNLVFDGTLPRGLPITRLNPQTAYGQQKAEAEQTLLDMAPDCVAIVRLTKVLDRGFPWFKDGLTPSGLANPSIPLPTSTLPLSPWSLPPLWLPR
jgi:dTDP-4-dehydrorhamnose reductase